MTITKTYSWQFYRHEIGKLNTVCLIIRINNHLKIRISNHSTYFFGSTTTLPIFSDQWSICLIIRISDHSAWWFGSVITLPDYSDQWSLCLIIRISDHSAWLFGSVITAGLFGSVITLPDYLAQWSLCLIIRISDHSAWLFGSVIALPDWRYNSKLCCKNYLFIESKQIEMSLLTGYA